MNTNDLIDLSMWAITVVPLFVVLVFAVCRVNAMHPRTRRGVRVAHIWLAGGAFSLLATAFVGGEINPQQNALFVIGVALCFATDHRSVNANPLPHKQHRRSHPA
jgi:hypothetical protein